MARRGDDSAATASPEEEVSPSSPATAPPAAARTRPARRHDGRRIAIVLGLVLVFGTVALSAAATYFHRIGDVARERYEAAGRR